MSNQNEEAFKREQKRLTKAYENNPSPERASAVLKHYYNHAMSGNKSWGNIMMEENKKQNANTTRSNRNRNARPSGSAAAGNGNGGNNGWTRVSRNRRNAPNRRPPQPRGARVMASNKRQEIIDKCKRDFMKNGTLKKIARKCKWHEQGKTCVCHQAGVCPFIHKGDPAWK